MTKLRFTQAIFLSLIIGLFTIGGTNASFVDTETSTNNSISAGSIDFALVGNANSSGIVPGFNETKNIKITKEGTLDFKYKVDLAITGGDSTFCNALLITLPSGQPLTISGTDTNVPVNISFGGGVGDQENKTCNFNLVFKAWQLNSDGTWGLTATETVDNTITSGVWDVTPPTSTITYPFNSNGDNMVQYTYIWNGKVEGTAHDDLSGVDHVELSISRTLLGLYLDKYNNWVNGTETGTRVLATPTSADWSTWSYSFHNQPPLGRFRIIAHAVDKAGNVENSAVIEFDNQAMPDPSLNTIVSVDRHYYSFTVENISDFSALSYSVIYDTDSAPKGFIGSVNLNNQSEYKNENILLGSESSGGGIAFDQNVNNIRITITLTRPDGTTLILEKTDN